MSATESALRNRGTVSASEVEKFHRHSSRWWGPKRRNILRAMNEVRVPFVIEGLLSNDSSGKIKSEKPLEGFRIIDVGCGGGYYCEPLARLGAQVTGLDPGAETIRIATAHAALDPDLQNQLSYICNTAEDLVGTVEQFDAVVCSEVLEHVDNPDILVESCVNLVKEGGSLFFTTPNKTYWSYYGAIILAEYVLGIIPKGTHDWHKFIPPADLQEMLEQQSCSIQSIRGILYNPFTDRCSWSNSTSMQYALHAVKLGSIN